MGVRRVALGLATTLLLCGIAVPGQAWAATLPASATVTVDERGFNPQNVTIALGGSVTWQNTGVTSHVVGSTNAPTQVTVGVDVGKSASWSFSLPGVYHYTSATDCSPYVTKALFQCLDYTVAVLDEPPGAPLPSPQATAQPSSTAAPSVAAAGTPVTINITDTGITPATMTVPVGATVTWLNQGLQVHTATSPAGTQSFDTGGLASGQSNTFTFSQPGRYTYTSAPDCLPSHANPAFDCGPYTLVVGTSPSAAPSQAATPVGPVAPASNTTVSIDDGNGFQPNTLTIKLGQSVTWLNKGTNVHAVTSDPGVIPSFDSGGLGAGQSFSFTPTAAGTYTYHSPPDASYFTSTGCNCPAPAYGSFSGRIVVGS